MQQFPVDQQGPSYNHPADNYSVDRGIAYQHPPQSELATYESQFTNSINDYVIEFDKDTIILNYKIDDFENDTLKRVLLSVSNFLRGRHAKIRLEVGYLLYHAPTGKLVYFYASKNTDMFEKEPALHVSNNADFNKLSQKVLSENWYAHYANRKDDTHYQFEKPCNLKVTIYLL